MVKDGGRIRRVSATSAAASLRRAAAADADLNHRVIWAGTSVDDIHHIATAADAIRHITSRA